ncbi:MAG: DUF1304 domain-containing protein [Chitinophagales bacterium]
MPVVSLIFATIAALIHVLFFLMESVFWMNPKVHKGFGVKSLEEAAQFKISFFNQGFYNLFLAIGVFAGLFLLNGKIAVAGIALILFCCSSMLTAAIVLFFSKPGMLRGVFIQGLCPLIAIITWCMK